MSYLGQVLAARLVALNNGFAIGTLTRRVGHVAVEVRILDRASYAAVQPAEGLGGPPGANDWLWMSAGIETTEFVLRAGSTFDSVQHLGIAWADDDGSGSMRLKAYFLAFEGCGDALP